MGIMDMLTNKTHDIHWGGAAGLWDICRHKAIGVPVLESLYRSAEDNELKNLIKSGIDMTAMPHIQKLQDFLAKEQLAAPPIPPRNKMDDQHIGLAIAEILRLSLVLDNIVFMSVTRSDLRKLVWDIMEEDKKAFDKIVNLLYEKSWTMNPPSAN
ncbi:MAG: DUF3231 family protein [Bacillota bacterium]